MAGHDGGSRAILAAFLANAGIALAKFVGFIFTGSASMLAESIHSVADTGNQGLLLIGGRKSQKLPTSLFPFGYSRERYFWSFVVALVLFTLGSAFAVYEGIHKLQHPEHLESPEWAYAILGVAIVLEGLSLRTAVRESAKIKGSMSWWRFLRCSKTPELPIVMLEDIGAQAGLIIALTAVTLSEVTDNARFDGAGTLTIGILLGFIAIFLAIEMKGLLIGEAADEGVQDTIVATIEADPQVQRVIHLRTQHLGPEDLLVAGKVEFDPSLTMAQVAAAVDRVEAAVRAEVPICELMYLEPDVHRDSLGADHQDREPDPPAAGAPAP